MNQNIFPLGWNEEKVRNVLTHYEEQSEEEAVAEDIYRQALLTDFSDDARKELETNVALYVRELCVVSIKLANRQSSDGISAAHVRRAAENLVARNRRLMKFLGVVGGVFFGASGSIIVAMTLGNQASIGGIIVASSTGILGGLLVALQFKND